MASLPRVKICGITSPEDAQYAISAGADAIGVVFYPPSPRHVSIDMAAAIARSAGPFITVVGLFVDPTVEFVNEVLSQVDLHVLQFHGAETDEFCTQFHRPFMKAIRMKPGIDVTGELKNYPSAVGILLDAYKKGVPGGTGESFDWQRVPVGLSMPIVLAGGLSPDNILDAISATHVYGVDVSGGVELSPGVKDKGRVESFVQQVKQLTV